jgi:transcriptional regulator with XRE-family HTH domain
VAHAAFLRAKARELRASRRLTIDEIAERLALSRSTVYHWVRDMPPVPAGPPQTAAQQEGTRAMQRKYRLLRETAYADALSEFETLSEDPTFRDFVCLYLAEGYKRSRNHVALGNSDSAVVVLANEWITRLSRNPVTYWLQYHADQDLEALAGHWGEQLRIEPTAVRFQRKSNSGQLSGRTWRSEYGVLTVRACDTILRARLGAWMDRLRSSWL